MPASATHDCALCKKSFVGMKNAKFCSRECFFNSMKKRVFFPCRTCGAQVEKALTKVRGGFCSHSCGAKQPKPWRRTYRARSATQYSDCAELYGSACRICGFKRVIEYAHIIPHSKGGTTHPTNIIPLCPNHHVLFDTGALTSEEEMRLAC